MIGQLNEPNLSFLLTGLWRATWQASALALVVLLVQWLIGQRLGGRGRYALWAIVLIRLLLPVLPESRFSIFNLTQRWDRHEPPAAVEPQVQIDQPIVVEHAGPKFIIVGEDHAATELPPATIPPASTPPPSNPLNPPTSHAHWSLLQWIAIAWLAGAVMIAIQIVIACWKLSRLMRRVPISSDPDLLQTLRDCATKLKLHRLPCVRISDSFPTPAIVGVIRPTLLLPAQVISSCDPREIRLIILHELAHLKRHDVAANWLIAIATLLHWFNPFVWLAAARMRADRELACDELVLSYSNESDERQAYGQTLVRLIEILALTRPMNRPRQMIGMVGILEQTRPMQRRVRMIARFNPTRFSHRIWTYGILVLLASIALTDAVRGDAKKQKSSASTQPSTRPAIDTLVDGAQTEADLKAKLQQRIGDLQIDNVPLSDVIDDLRTRSGANITVHWHELEAAGIESKIPIKLNLRNITLKQALDHVLNDAGGGSVKLGHTIADGSIIVAPEDSLGEYTTTVAYDITDLISTATTKPSDEGESITQAIEGMIEPESWKDVGGTIGWIHELNGKLIVQQTQNAQDQIADFFRLLREKSKNQAGAHVDSNAVQPNALFGGRISPETGQSQPMPVQPRTVVADAEMENAIVVARAELNRKLPEVKFDNTPLSDAIDFLRDTTGANISVNWSMLKLVGIDQNTACKLTLKDATLEKCLDATFKQLTGGEAVAIVIDRNVLTITTQMDIPSYMVTKTYNVKDLQTGGQLDQVVTMLLTNQPGGGTVQVFGDRLIVTTSLTSHDQVSKLLASLRDGATTQPTADSKSTIFDSSGNVVSK